MFSTQQGPEYSKYQVQNTASWNYRSLNVRGFSLRKILVTDSNFEGPLSNGTSYESIVGIADNKTDNVFPC